MLQRQANQVAAKRWCGHAAFSGSLTRASGLHHMFLHRRTLRCAPRSTALNAIAQLEFKGCATPLAQPIKVVGCGSCGVDYLASVLEYPKPDEKLRTETFEVQGGGNCANALTACSRLGLSPAIMTKIGGDGLGDGIISELAADGVDTRFILRAADSPSPFTYIIVDRAGGTRTCIHTPGEALQPSEVEDKYCRQLLEGAALVYFDGRLTEAALKLAEHAKQAGIPILVEAERLRPNLDQLLQYADYVLTSAHFPQDWTGEKVLTDALLSTFKRLPHAKVVITTRGTQGSILLQRTPPAGPATAAAKPDAAGTAGSGPGGAAAAAEGATAEAGGSGAEPQAQPRALDVVVAELQSRLQAANGVATTSGSPDCISSTGTSIWAQSVVATEGFVQLAYSEDHSLEEALNQAREAACRAAALNAEAGNVAGYAMCPGLLACDCNVRARVLLASIASLPGDSVVDTTGAGDAFLGAVVYGIVTGMGWEAVLRLAAVVAAAKCTALGARPGLPRREQLAPGLLG